MTVVAGQAVAEDHAVSAAARDLLAENGTDKGGPPAAAEHVPTSNEPSSRWRDDMSLALEAVRVLRPIPEGADTGGLRGDLLEFLRVVAERVRRADVEWLGHLVSGTQVDPRLAVTVRNVLQRDTDQVAREMLERASERGERLAGVDALGFGELIRALVMNRVLFSGEGLDEGYRTWLVDTVLIPAVRPQAPETDRRAVGRTACAEVEPAPVEPFVVDPPPPGQLYQVRLPVAGTYVILSVLDGPVPPDGSLVVGADYSQVPIGAPRPSRAGEDRAGRAGGSAQEREPLVVSDLRVDPLTRDVTRGQVPITLSATEYALLCEFLRRPGEVLTRTHLLEHVWRYSARGTRAVDVRLRSNVVDNYVRHLRNRIDRPFGRDTLKTVRAVGYRLDPEA